jgi:hypothetical protein
MGAYISEFIKTWAVIYTKKNGVVIIEEYYTKAAAEKRLAELV